MRNICIFIITMNMNKVKKYTFKNKPSFLCYFLRPWLRDEINVCCIIKVLVAVSLLFLLFNRRQLKFHSIIASTPDGFY